MWDVAMPGKNIHIISNKTIHIMVIANQYNRYTLSIRLS